MLSPSASVRSRCELGRCVAPPAFPFCAKAAGSQWLMQLMLPKRVEETAACTAHGAIRTCKLALMRGSSRPLSRAEAETRERKVLAGEGACSAQMLCAS
jgi:hypothetical protein